MILVHITLPKVFKATLVGTTVFATYVVWYDIKGKWLVSNIQTADDGCAFGDEMTEKLRIARGLTDQVRYNISQPYQFFD